MRVLVAIIFSIAASSFGATNLAPSGSWSDVSNAVRVSVSGDTVSIPAGTNLWQGPIIVTNGLTIRGAGTNETCIQNDQIKVDGKEMPSFQVINRENRALRLTGIWFDGVPTANKSVNEGGCGIRFDPPSVLNTQVRVDRCKFTRFGKAIYMRQGGGFGVVDHCEFDDNYVVLRDVGYWETNAALWQMVTNAVGNTPWPWNTSNTLVFEDNTVAWASWTNGIYVADTEGPSTYTFRHNTINVNRTSTASLEGWDMHNIPQTNFVFNVGVKVYANTINVSGSLTVNPTRYANIRGGGGSLVYSNTVTGINGSIMFSRNIAIGPYLTNSYCWANTGEGGVPWVVNTGDPPYDGPVVNVNFFTNAPTDFAELTYPHPLVTLQDGQVGRIIRANTIKIGILKFQ